MIDCCWNVSLSKSETGGSPSVIRANTVTTPAAPMKARIARPVQIARAIQPAALGLVRGSRVRAGRAIGGASYTWDSGDELLAEGCHRRSLTAGDGVPRRLRRHLNPGCCAPLVETRPRSLRRVRGTGAIPREHVQAEEGGSQDRR